MIYRKIKWSNKPLLVWVENNKYQGFDGEGYSDIGSGYFKNSTIPATEKECKKILEIFNKKD